MLRIPPLLLALLALVVPPSAHAGDGVWRGTDPSGDVAARAFSPDPPPCGTVTHPDVAEGDIIRLDVRHRPRAVKVAIRMATATPVQDLHLTVPVRTSRRHYLVSVDEHNGRLRSDVLVVEPIRDEDIQVDECGNQFYTFVSYGSSCRVSVTAAPRLLTAVVPRECLGDPKWVRVGAEVSAGNESMWHIDRWAPPGYDDTKWWIHTYGPRVRVSR